MRFLPLKLSFILVFTILKQDKRIGLIIEKEEGLGCIPGASGLADDGIVVVFFLPSLAANDLPDEEMEPHQRRPHVFGFA